MRLRQRIALWLFKLAARVDAEGKVWMLTSGLGADQPGATVKIHWTITCWEWYGREKWSRVQAGVGGCLR